MDSNFIYSGQNDGIVKLKFISQLTSVGPAYIMGDGKIAMTVLFGSNTPSSIMALCCSILTGRGTSSLLVQPPSGGNTFDD